MIAWMVLVLLLFGCQRSIHWSTKAFPQSISRTGTPRSSVRWLAATVPPIRSIAVIGGGIAGLSCAQRLAQHYEVTVFDTGRLRSGGRCSSRCAGDAPKKTTSEPANGNGLLSKFTYDHAAQIVSCPTHPRYKPFLGQLQEWEEKGIVRAVPHDALYDIHSFQKFTAIREPKFYLGTTEGGGIGGIASHMAKSSGGSFQMKQDVWVPPRHGVEHMNNRWKVRGDSGRPGGFGTYDAMVIAHNGKCADQLMSSAPCLEISDLLKVKFDHKLPNDGGRYMTLSSIYSLTFAIPAKGSLLSATLPSSFWSGYVQNHPALRFLSCQTRKYPNRDGDESIEVWTVLSSGVFGKRYKAPQENLPDKMITRVSRLLLLALEQAMTGVKIIDPDDPLAELPPPSSLESMVLDQHLQLWGAGVPMNLWEVERGRTPAGFLYDGTYRVGVCGDWLMEASIAGAWTSGHLLAGQMINQSINSHGLRGSFRRSSATAKAGIGMLQV